MPITILFKKINDVITYSMDFHPSVLESTDAEDDECFYNLSGSSKIESRGTFDMYGDYIDWIIVQDTELYYFDADDFGEYYNSTIDCCVRCTDTFQAHEHSISLSELVQI